mgnify:CR=1 FL=1
MRPTAAALMAMAAVAVLTGCPSTELPFSVPDLPGVLSPAMSDEEQIAAVLDDVQRGMESRRIYQVLAHVSRNYKDQEGRNYAGVQAYLNRRFREYREIRVTRTPPRIQVQGNWARAIESFGTRAKPEEPDFGLGLNIQGQVTINLEKVGDTWQITEWGPLQ